MPTDTALPGPPPASASTTPSPTAAGPTTTGPTTAGRPRPGRPRRASIAAAVAALILLAGVIGWLGQVETVGPSRDDPSSGLMKGRETEGAGAGVEADRQASSADGSDASGSETQPATPSKSGGAAEASRTTTPSSAVGPKVIRTGSVDVVTGRGRLVSAERSLRVLAEGAGGYVAGSKSAVVDGAATASLDLRVAAEQLDAVLARIRQLGRITTASTSSQDVTGEYTDLESRLRAARAEREQILIVLQEAQNVPEILAVRDRLDDLQAQIEEMEGRQRMLDDQTSLASLQVSLRERTAPAADRPAQRAGLAAAWDDAVDGFVGGVEAVVRGSGIVLFLLVLAVAVWFGGRPLWRRVNR